MVSIEKIHSILDEDIGEDEDLFSLIEKIYILSKHIKDNDPDFKIENHKTYKTVLIEDRESEDDEG